MGSLHWSRLLSGTNRGVERGAHTRASFLVGFVTL